VLVVALSYRFPLYCRLKENLHADSYALAVSVEFHSDRFHRLIVSRRWPDHLYNAGPGPSSICTIGGPSNTP
jgi:hypothetical protein